MSLKAPGEKEFDRLPVFGDHQVYLESIEVALLVQRPPTRSVPCHALQAQAVKTSRQGKRMR